MTEHVPMTGDSAARQLTHTRLEDVSHPCGPPRYAESGWWAGVPRERAAR